MDTEMRKVYEEWPSSDLRANRQTNRTPHSCHWKTLILHIPRLVLVYPSRQAEKFPRVDDCSRTAAATATVRSQSYYTPFELSGLPKGSETVPPWHAAGSAISGPRFLRGWMGAVFPTYHHGRLVFVLSHKQDVLHFRKLIAVFQVSSALKEANACVERTCQCLRSVSAWRDLTGEVTVVLILLP